MSDKVIVSQDVVSTLVDTFRFALEHNKQPTFSAGDLRFFIEALSVPVSTPVGEAGSMPGTTGFTMAAFKAEDVPLGTKLYAK